MIISKIRVCSLSVLLCTLASSAAHAGIVWDESVNGELSDLNRYGHPDPTQRGAFSDLGPLTAGVSTIRGTCIRTSSATDGDAVRINVPSGFTLTEIIFSHTSIAGLREFFRLGSGGPGPYFLSRTYPSASLGLGTQDLMQLYGPADGLTSGSYVLSWENLGIVGSSMSYTLDLVLVPSPGAAVVGVVATGCTIVRRRRGRQMTSGELN